MLWNGNSGGLAATGMGGVAGPNAGVGAAFDSTFGTITTAVQFGQRACPPAADDPMRSSFWHCGQRNSIRFPGSAVTGGTTESVIRCDFLALSKLEVDQPRHPCAE
jgi:hypothetical protein